MATTFTESQKFRQWWLWVLMSPLIILPIIAVVRQIILDKPFGSNPMSDTGILIFALFCLSILCLFLFMNLKTTIDDRGIAMHYRPFLRRMHSWHEIDRVELIDYGFVGYGFRWWPKHGWIYNVGGNMGLKIHFKSGKQYTIGTQKPEELQHFLLETGRTYSSATA